MDASAKPSLLFSLISWRVGADTEPSCEATAEAASLFQTHRQPLLRYLRSIGLPAQECDEIVQEVFFSLFLHLKAGKPRQNLAGWIFRVAHNLGLKIRSQISSDRLVVLDKALTEHHPDPQRNGEQRMMDIERYRRLRSVVAALAEQERQCLFLRAEGLRYREIAGVLDLSIGTVSSLLTRALDKLKRADGAINR